MQRRVDRELAAYGAGLAERPQLVVLNKIDLFDEPPAFELATALLPGVHVPEPVRETIERAGHYPHIEQPDEFARRVFAFTPGQGK